MSASAWADLDQPEGGAASAPAGLRVQPATSAPTAASSSTGLWRHSGLEKAPPKWKIIVLILLIFVGYGTSMLVNGASSRLLTPRFVVGGVGGGGGGLTPSSLEGLGLVVGAADPIFLLASFRVVSTLLLLLGMLVLGNAPPRVLRWRASMCRRGPAPLVRAESTDSIATTATTAASPAPDADVESPKTDAGVRLASHPSPHPSDVIDVRGVAVPVAIGVSNCLGYLPYMVLCRLDSVALWSALVGLYVIIPVAYGVVFRQEARSKKKFAGIVACIAAGILLGLPADGIGTGDAPAGATGTDGAPVAPGWVKFLLFLTCIGLWGACDGMVAFVGRDTHPFYVAGFTAIGFAVGALVAAWVQFVAIASIGPVPSVVYLPAGGANSSAAGMGGSGGGGGPAQIGQGGAEGYVLLFFAQLCGILAWYASVTLGTMSEASAFLPITALYTILVSIGSVVVLGESLPVLGWIGVAMAAVGMSLIATA
jgi:hypothetical protein